MDMAVIVEKRGEKGYDGEKINNTGGTRQQQRFTQSNTIHRADITYSSLPGDDTVMGIILTAQTGDMANTALLGLLMAAFFALLFWAAVKRRKHVK